MNDRAVSYRDDTGRRCLRRGCLGRRQGFTLLEIMFSIALLSIVFLALIAGYIQCARLNEITRYKLIAVEDCRRIIEQMRSLAVEDVAVITGINWTAWAAANGFTSLPDQQVVVFYTDRDGTGNPLDDDPLEVAVEVSWNWYGQTRTVQLETLITAR